MEQDSGLFIRRIVSDVSDAIIASDPEYGILEWNPAAEAMYGYTREEARGKQIAGLARREYIGTTRQKVIDEFAANGHWKGEVYDYTKDGKRLLVQTRVSRIHGMNDEFIGIVAVNRDITEQRLCQIREYRHNKVYRLLAEATATCLTRSELCEYIVNRMVDAFDAKAVMFHISGNHDNAECACYSTGVSENLVKTLGKDPIIQDRLFRKKEHILVRDLLEYKEKAIWIEVLKQYHMRSILAWPICLPDQEPLGAICVLSDSEFDICNDDNSHLENFANMIATAVHRVTTEEKTREYRQNLETIFEHILDVYFRIDPEGNLLSISKSGKDLFELKHESDVVNQNVCDWLFTGKNDFDEFQKVITQNDQVKNYCFRGKTLNGKVLDLEVNARVEFDDQHERKYIEGLIRDVTLRKAMEEEVREKDRLENMGFVVGSVAHSFNNNLTAVLGSVSVALHYADDNSKLMNFLKKAESGCLKAKQTVQQLMMISGSIKPLCRPLDIMPILKTAATHARSIGKTIVQLDDKVTLHRVKANEKLLLHVFTHILNNAVEAMQGEGQVTIFVDVKTPTDSNNDKPKLPIVEICFKDIGPGMEKDVLKRVFEPFFTTHAASRGLGLPVCRAIVRRMDGSITVDSSSSGGAMVTIRFPACEMVAHFRNYSIEKRVLVLDPSDIVRQVVVDLVNELGYEAIGVDNGAECIRQYRAGIQDNAIFDVVFIDLGSKESNVAPAVLKMIRKINPEAKAIATTGYADHAVMNDYKLHGFDGKLLKPFRLSSVEEVLNQILS